MRKHYVWDYGSKDLWNYGKVKNDDVSKGKGAFYTKKAVGLYQCQNLFVFLWR